MYVEKALINYRLRVSKVSWKFRIPTIYNFAVFTPEICYFLKKYFLTVLTANILLLTYFLAYFLTVSIVFSVCKESFTAQ